VAALSTEFVLAEEAAAIHGGNTEPKDHPGGLRHHTRGVKVGVGDDDGCEERGKRQRAFYRELNEKKRAALCLSGGGIRSAAFGLGVIEALARQQVDGGETHHVEENTAGDCKPKDHGKPEYSLLAQFHYLSTVSGGGYIGSWLSAWRLRASFPRLWSNLVGRPCGPDEETATIGWLRAYSNYLTPKLGLLSGDFWAAIAICLRNMILNWLIIIPVVCIVLLIIKLIAVFGIGVAHHPPTSWITGLFGVLWLVLQVFALRLVNRHRPTRRALDEPRGIDQRFFLWFILLPAGIAAAGFIQLASSNSGLALLDHHGKAFVFIIAALAGAVIYALSWLLAGRRYHDYDFGYWTASGLVYGLLLGVGAYAYNQAPTQGYLLFNDLLLPMIFGVPWIIVSQMIAEMIFVALASYEKNSDSDREWLARAAGWYLLTALGWLIGTLLIFAGSLMAEGLVHGVDKWLAPMGGISGAVIAWLGKSPLSQGRGPQAKGAWPITTGVILTIAAIVFVVALIVFLSAGLDWLMFDGTALAISLRFPGTEIFTPIWWTVVLRLLIGLAVTGVIALIASYFVNINRFSLHALYRNRLVRAFLGASRPRRHPDDFTDFDADDNPRVHELWPEKPKNSGWPEPDRADWRPFHVINMTLNIVSTRHLSWQERKAESFTVSPLHAGSACKAYRRTREYGAPDGGITLGTAVAISGAAASPNMGYHSSPGITLLLALFNVRLGWWLGNPGREGDETYWREGPRFAIRPLLEETFGLTTDTKPYVYLSDGGHFENLGIYEMVRRRCRFIISVDAGADPDYGFEDLGNAQRKIALDLGVPIRFYGLTKLKKRPAEGQADIGPDCPYHAIGVIDYPTADHGGEKGYILYIKAGYHGVEGPGVCSYAVANPTFPHQTTADQWFSESQFESYRALGFTIANQLLTATLDGLGATATLKEIFEALSRDCGEGP